jgi:hypothetical protein
MSERAEETRSADEDEIPVAEYPYITAIASSSKDRRSVLKAGVAAVAGAGAYALLNVFPQTRPAFAQRPPYVESNIYNPYPLPGGRIPACNTDEGCTGPPAELIDNYFCATCDEFRADPFANWFNYYLNGRRGQAVFFDMDNNICRNNPGSVDLWIHPEVPCGFCASQLDARCQDGYKDPDSAIGPTFCICHAVHRCNGVLTGQFC